MVQKRQRQKKKKQVIISTCDLRILRTKDWLKTADREICRFAWNQPPVRTVVSLLQYLGFYDETQRKKYGRTLQDYMVKHKSYTTKLTQHVFLISW